MKDSTPALSHELHERRISRVVWLTAFAFALFLGVAFFAAKPIVHWAKATRSRHFAAQSEAFTAQGKWQEAFSTAQAAYQLKSDEPDALRAMAHFYERARPAAAVPFLRILAGLDTATPGDLRDYSEACLLQRNLPEARSQAGRLLQMEPANPDNLRLAARIEETAGNVADGLRFAREAEQKEPQNLPGQFLRARLEIFSNDAEARKSGWDTLWRLGHGQGTVGVESLHLLARWRDLPEAQEKELRDLLRDEPRVEDRLLGAELDLRFHPERRKTIVAEVVAQAKGADGNVLRTVGIWLNGIQEFDATLAILPEKVAISRQDLFLVYLDTLAATNRWKDVERLLAIKDVPLNDVYLHVFQARVAEENGRKEEAEFDWQRAHASATGDPRQMNYLAQYAERAGREDQAVLAYQSLAADLPTARIAYENLLRIAQGHGDTARVRDLLEEMMKRWQSEPAVRNDYAYLNILLGQNLMQCRNVAMGLVSALPNELPHRTTLALALLRTNDPQSALNVYSGLNIPWERAPDRDKAVYAAVLGANGDKEAAGRMAASVALGNLFKEERDLVKPWLKPAPPLEAPGKSPAKSQGQGSLPQPRPPENSLVFG